MSKKNRRMIVKKKPVICVTAAAVLTAGAVIASFFVPRKLDLVSAKETFSGVGQVVKEHSEKSFQILDIVPAYGEYAGSRFSLGTMGYIAGGQSTIDEELIPVLATKMSYTDRKAIIEEMFGDGNSGSIYSLQYREAYPGIDANINTYHKLLEAVAAPTEEQEVPTGSLEAYVEKWDKEGEAPAGYDYDIIDGSQNQEDTTGTFKADANGKYRVVFGSPSNATSGYRVVSASETLADYSKNTGVYTLNNGVYEYAGTIESVSGVLGEQGTQGDRAEEEDREKEKEETDKPDEDKSDKEEQGQSDSDKEEQGQSDSDKEEQGQSDSDKENQGESGSDKEEQGQSGSDKEEQGQSDSDKEEQGQSDSDRENQGESDSDREEQGQSDSDKENQGESDSDKEDKQEQGTPAQGEETLGKETPSSEMPDSDASGEDNPSAEHPEGDNASTEEQVSGLVTSPNRLQWVRLVAETPVEEAQTEPTPTEQTKYYVVLFEYVKNLEEEQFLYQAISKEELVITEGEPVPFDRYSLVGETDSGNAENSVQSENIQEPSAGNNVQAESAGEQVFKYLYVGSGKGRFKLTRADSTDANYATAVKAELRNVPVYMKCCPGNNTMERYVFNSIAGAENAQAGFEIEVITVTPGEVSTEMVANADMIYLESGMNSAFSDRVTVKKLSADDTYISDFSETVFNSILHGVVVSSKPIIADYDAVDVAGAEYKNSVYYDLVRCLLKEDLFSFYYDMSKGNKLLANCILNLDSEDYPDKKSNNYHFINRNVYIVSGTPLVNEDFLTVFDNATAQSGFDEVIRAIKTENAGKAEEEKLSEEITKAKAVQYIISLANGLVGDYKNLTILELQPTNGSFTDLHLQDSNGGTVLFWQRDNEAVRNGNVQKEPGQQLLNTKKKLQANINLKSVSQFNGELADINSTYDMIFIGLDAEYAYVNSADGKYVYNDTALTGWAYHSGDRVSNSDSRYDANDITQQKKEDLLCFLRAGYPIVVEDAFFINNTTVDANEESINTAMIAQNTNLYAFLADALRDYNDYLYTVREVRGNSVFRTQLNVVKPELVDRSEEAAVVRSAQESQTEPGTYSIKIPYEVQCTRDGENKEAYPEEVTKKVYLDVNYDGRFCSEEQLLDSEYTDTDSTVEIKVKGSQNGCIPWKIEVCDAGNEYRRASISGLVTLTGNKRNVISVLQIMDNPDAEDATNLEIYQKDIKNMVLSYYLNVAETRLNVAYEFTTLSVGQLAGRLSENVNYVNEFDILILGLEQSGDLSAVSAAIETYMESGKSTLICRDALLNNDFLKQSSLTGISNERTYIELGRASDEKYRYNVLTPDMLSDSTGNYVDMVNFGSIGFYPFELRGLQLAGATHAEAPKFRLRVDENDPGAAESYITGWYTLDKTIQGMNAYKASPKDVGNNYYVASKCNVVYLGQTRYPYTYKGTDPDASTTDGIDESQLFVNALMAAYNAGTHIPKVSIVAGFGVEAEKVESICVPYDEEMTAIDNTESGMLENTVNVFFSYEDNNIALAKENTLSFYYEDDTAAEVDMGNNKAKATAFESRIWTVENNKLVEVTNGQIQPGKVYRISAPVISLKNRPDKTNADIYVVIRSKLKLATGEKEVVASDSVLLNRAQLFLLE